MFLGFLRKVFSRNTDEEQLLTKQWLKKRGVHNPDFQVHIVNAERIESTEEFLKSHGVDRSAVITDELRKAEVEHRINSRRLVLLSLIVPMSIAPFWLMVLLSLPAFDKKPYSESMQAAFLAALVSDFVGLYYVITRDLFPKGEASHREASKDEMNDQTGEQSDGKTS